VAVNSATPLKCANTSVEAVVLGGTADERICGTVKGFGCENARGEHGGVDNVSAGVDVVAVAEAAVDEVVVADGVGRV
jgi:hypothetical protein